MNRDEAKRVTDRIKAAWGGQMTASQAEVWIDHLNSRDDRAGWAALRTLEMTASRRPSIAEFIEAYKVEYIRTRTDAERAVARGDCPFCFGEGWERVSYEGHGTVRRCRERCAIPQPDLEPVVALSDEQKARNLDRLHAMMADLRLGRAAPLPERRSPVAAPLADVRDPSGST